MKDHLIFDTTDADTIKDSDKVGAFITANDGTLITKHTITGTNAGKYLDVYAALAAGDGTPITQTGGAIDVNLKTSDVTLDAKIDGIYSGGNTDPDNVGVIAHTRGLNPADSDQIQRTTASTTDQDAVVAANVHGLDVNSFSMIYNGTTWDRLTGTAGSVNVNVTGSTGTITVTDAALANGTIIAKSLVLAAADTAQAVVTAPLAARKYLWIYNEANQRIFIGGAGVTALTGFPISPGSYMELRAGVSQAVNFVGSAGKTPEVRTLEAA